MPLKKNPKNSTRKTISNYAKQSKQIGIQKYNKLAISFISLLVGKTKQLSLEKQRRNTLAPQHVRDRQPSVISTEPSTQQSDQDSPLEESMILVARTQQSPSRSSPFEVINHDAIEHRLLAIIPSLQGNTVDQIVQKRQKQQQQPSWSSVVCRTLYNHDGQVAKVWQKCQKTNEKSTKSSKKEQPDLEKILGPDLDIDLDRKGMFVLPGEARKYEALCQEINHRLTDTDNVCSVNRVLQQLWHESRNRISDLNFFFQMFVFLFERYLVINTCRTHQPPCKPRVDTKPFRRIAVPILQRFCRSINPERNTIIQTEMLVAIESLVYIKQAYQVAVVEVFDLLFKFSIVEAVVFLEWSRLEDPSKHFDTTPIISLSKSAEQTVSEHHQNIDQHQEDRIEKITRVNITDRDRLLMRLRQSGFLLLKKSHSIA